MDRSDTTKRANTISDSPATADTSTAPSQDFRSPSRSTFSYDTVAKPDTSTNAMKACANMASATLRGRE